MSTIAGQDLDDVDLAGPAVWDDPVPRRDINVKADRAAVRARCVALSMVYEELGRPVRPVRPVVA